MRRRTWIKNLSTNVNSTCLKCTKACWVGLDSDWIAGSLKSLLYLLKQRWAEWPLLWHIWQTNLNFFNASFNSSSVRIVWDADLEVETTDNLSANSDDRELEMVAGVKPLFSEVRLINALRFYAFVCHKCYFLCLNYRVLKQNSSFITLQHR